MIHLRLCNAKSNFYPRSPCGERPLINTIWEILSPISIHALLAESDKIPNQSKIDQKNFYPRSPCGERLLVLQSVIVFLPISIHALLAESDVQPRKTEVPGAIISIHALLAESDSYRKNLSLQAEQFLSTLSLRRATFAGSAWVSEFPISIHALLAESDFALFSVAAASKVFLSTLSLRRATLPCLSSWDRLTNFYPRSPCGERPGAVLGIISAGPISIHALLAESDRSPLRSSSLQSRFLSTLSLRRATSGFLLFRICSRDFYPRSPCGERLEPLWAQYRRIIISIHALLAESDCFLLSVSQAQNCISIHALLAESDHKSCRLYRQS